MGMQDKHQDQDRSRDTGHGESGHGKSGKRSRSGSGHDRSKGMSGERSSSPSSMPEDIRDVEDTEQSMRDRMDQDYEL